MPRRLALLLISLLVAAFGVAGCGDDDEDSGSSGGTPTEESSTKDSAGDATPGLSGEAAEQAAENCKKSISTQAQQLSADVVKDLEEICEKAADGDEDAVREASKEVCVKIIEDKAPAGPARDQAIEACEQAGQTP